MGIETSLYKDEDIKNYLMNANLGLLQRGIEGTISSAGSHYVFDRFNWFTNLGLTVDVTPVTPPNDESGEAVGINACRIERNAGVVSVVNDTLNSFSQAIEGKFLRPLIGKKVVFSFWVRCNKAHTSCFRVRNPSADKTYLEEFTIDAPNTWQRIEIPFEVLGSDSWNTNNSAGMYVGLALDTGSDFYGVEGWQAGDVYGTATQDAVFDSNNTWIEFAGLMVYEAEKAIEPKFKTMSEDIQEELQLCQRYYCKSYDEGFSAGDITNQGRIQFRGDSIISIKFHEEKRDIPIVTVYSPATGAEGQANRGGLGDGACTITDESLTRFSATITSSDIFRVHYTADAEL